MRYIAKACKSIAKQDLGWDDPGVMGGKPAVKDQIGRLMVELGYANQTAFALAIPVRDETMSGWFNNKQEPQRGNLASLARMRGVTLAQMEEYFEDGTPLPTSTVAPPSSNDGVISSEIFSFYRWANERGLSPENQLAMALRGYRAAIEGLHKPAATGSSGEDPKGNI